jgi:hypothetical protein
MNILLWLAFSLGAWCAVAGVAGLVLGRLIAFGTGALVVTPRPSLWPVSPTAANRLYR